MLNVTKTYATVWEPKINDYGIATANVSTSRSVKNKETKEISYYINSSWKTTFVGKAKEKFETLENKSRIVILSARVEYAKAKDKDGNNKLNAEGKSPYYLSLTIFDFELAENYKEEDKSADDFVTINEEGLPF